MANAAPQLQEAYELIEAGDLDSARQLLEEIRSNNENNPDFWWIYSHAVQDKEEGLSALDRVRQLAPNYPGLQTLSEQFGISSAKTPQPLSPPVPVPSTEAIEAFNNTQDSTATQEESGSNLPFLLIAGVVVFAIIGGLFFVANLGNGNGDDTPTETAFIIDSSPELIVPTSGAESATEDTVDAIDSPTDEPTETEAVAEDATDVPAETEVIVEDPTDEPTETESVAEDATDVPTETEAVIEEPTPTEEEPTLEPTATIRPTEVPSETPEPEDVDPFEDVYSDLEAFGVPEGGITVEDTETFGQTYIVTTCSSLGPVATQNILDIIATLQPIADDLDSDVDGFGFNITDCDADTVRLTLGVEREIVNSYWTDAISITDLQQALQRVD